MTWWIDFLEIELFDPLTLYKQCLIELLVIHSNTWNHLTVYKQMSNVEEKNC